MPKPFQWNNQEFLIQLGLSCGLLYANWMLWSSKTIFLLPPTTQSSMPKDIPLSRTADDIARGMLAMTEARTNKMTPLLQEGHSLRSQYSQLQGKRVELEIQLLAESKTVLEKLK